MAHLFDKFPVPIWAMIVLSQGWALAICLAFSWWDKRKEATLYMGFWRENIEMQRRHARERIEHRPPRANDYGAN